MNRNPSYQDPTHRRRVLAQKEFRDNPASRARLRREFGDALFPRKTAQEPKPTETDAAPPQISIDADSIRRIAAAVLAALTGQADDSDDAADPDNIEQNALHRTEGSVITAQRKALKSAGTGCEGLTASEQRSWEAWVDSLTDQEIGQKAVLMGAMARIEEKCRQVSKSMNASDMGLYQEAFPGCRIGEDPFLVAEENVMGRELKTIASEAGTALGEAARHVRRIALAN